MRVPDRLVIPLALALATFGVLLLVFTEPVGEPGHVRPAVDPALAVTTHFEGCAS